MPRHSRKHPKIEFFRNFRSISLNFLTFWLNYIDFQLFGPLFREFWLLFRWVSAIFHWVLVKFLNFGRILRLSSLRNAQKKACTIGRSLISTTYGRLFVFFLKYMFPKERTLLSEIRTASIFIGLVYLISTKMAEKFKKIKYFIIVLLTIILIMNVLSIINFYNELTIKKKYNLVLADYIPIIYGIILTIFIFMMLIWLMISVLFI